MKKALLATVSVLSAALLAGCGGGGGDEAVVVTQGASAEGVYGGTLTNKAGSTAIRMLILENGQFWALYGDEVGGAFEVDGLYQGTGTSSNLGGVATFISPSTSAKDFTSGGAAAVALSSNYNTTAKTINGTVTAGTTVNFSGGPITGGTYNYNTAAVLATVDGVWTVTGLAGETYTLTVDSNNNTFDAVPTLVGGCNFSGTIVPRASGKNVFTVSLLTGVGCLPPGTTSTGIALAYPLTGGDTQLVLGVVNAGRTSSAVVFGTRP